MRSIYEPDFDAYNELPGQELTVLAVNDDVKLALWFNIIWCCTRGVLLSFLSFHGVGCFVRSLYEATTKESAAVVRGSKTNNISDQFEAIAEGGSHVCKLPECAV